MNPDRLAVCVCCLFIAENGDTSTCRDYFRHTVGGPAQDAPDHPTEPGSVPVGYVHDMDGCETDAADHARPDGFVCDTCGRFVDSPGEAHAYRRVGDPETSG